jgi:hypothetical protein
MRGVASWETMAGLSAWVVFATGCAERPLPPRDASSAAVGGVAEGQAPDPATRQATGTDGTDGTDGSYAHHDSRRTRRTLGWIALAAGAEGAVVAGVTSFMLLHQKKVLDADCNAQKICSSDGMNAAGVINETVPWNTAAWIVAAVGLGGGTILLLTSRSDSGKTTAVTVSPAPAGASFGLRSDF